MIVCWLGRTWPGPTGVSLRHSGWLKARIRSPWPLPGLEPVASRHPGQRQTRPGASGRELELELKSADRVRRRRVRGTAPGGWTSDTWQVGLATWNLDSVASGHGCQTERRDSVSDVAIMILVLELSGSVTESRANSESESVTLWHCDTDSEYDAGVWHSHSHHDGKWSSSSNFGVRVRG
jgi:hypothetical protein